MIEWGDLAQMPPNWARVWLYGPPRTGKTIAAACMPSPFFVFLANEDSETSLRGMGARFARIGVAPPNLRQGDPVPVIADMEGVISALLAANAQGKLYERFGLTLVVDSFGHYNDLAIAEIAHRTVSRSDKVDEMSQAKWGLLRAHYLHLRDVLFGLPMHVVFTSFAQCKTVANTVVYAGPQVSGSAAELLPGSFGALGYCETDPAGRRQVWFRQQGAYPAGVRYQGVPEGPIPNHELWAYLAPALGHSR